MTTMTATAIQRFEEVHPRDARLSPVFEELVREYERAYGDFEGYAEAEVHGVDEERFTRERGGAFVALVDDEQDAVIATGAVRRFDDRTAEFKRIWAHPERRGERLASRMLERLEERARELGYGRAYLTTGPRQPAADRLYRRSGFTPHYDPEAFTMHAYVKPLDDAAESERLPTAAVEQLIDFEDLVRLS